MFYDDDIEEMLSDFGEDREFRHYTAAAVAYTNDPAVGTSIVLNVASTGSFSEGGAVEVSSSAGQEVATVTTIVTNTSVTVDRLTKNHTLNGTVRPFTAKTVLAIFDDAGSVQMLGDTPVETTAPQIHVASADVADALHGDRIVVNGTAYYILEKTANAGMTKIILSEDPL